MPIASANGMDLHYDDYGPHDAPVVLLVMGLGTQSTAWPQPLIDGLVARGFRVVRFDNRDIGLSTHLHGAVAVHPLVALAASRLRLPFPLAYTLTDMAADAVALLDALGIAAAHVVGASMGGMIAQTMAARWPARVLTLTSIMSSSGAPGLPGPSPKLRRRLIAKRPADPSRDQAVAAGAEILDLISYPDPAREDDAFRTAAGLAFDRAYNPAGARRQLLAILADTGRARRVGRIVAPTLIVHGAADPLVPVGNAHDLAQRIPGARLVVIEQMAHDLPPLQTPALVDLIAGHALAAG